MGFERGLAATAAVLAIVLLSLSMNLLFLQHPREELTAGVQATGMLPADRIQKDQVQVYTDHVSISIPGVRWANFSATGSMLPVLGSGAYALQVVPLNAGEIQVGDIVSYKYEGKIIIHRVIEINSDESGWYAITKGDNNPEPDPEPVRFSQIDRVVVGILY
ncbi:MAG: signal peptidase I [Candidatus Woesearchaeota archaeon]